jgi:hypothetical protein
MKSRRLSVSPATWPLAARAQQATIPLVGYFSGRSSESEELLLSSFGEGLEEEGFTIGKNIAVEYRFSDGDEGRLPAIAADFVRRRTTVIVASGTPSAVAAKTATSTVPIVFSTGIDPVSIGDFDGIPGALRAARDQHSLAICDRLWGCGAADRHLHADRLSYEHYQQKEEPGAQAEGLG